MYAAIYPDKFVVEVSDEGIGIEDIEKARQPLYTSKPEWNVAGWDLPLWKPLWTK